MEENKKHYFGITIGPIDRVLTYAHSTRAIWASSYFFSDLARRIVEPLYKAGHRFLKPIVSDDLFTERDTVGRFPDQYIFEAREDDSIVSFAKHREGVLKDITERMAKVLNADEKKIEEYVNRTIKVYILKLSADSSKSDDDIVLEMQNRMSCAECRDIFSDSEGINWLSALFESDIPVLRKFFELEGLTGFDSLPEVAYNKYVAFVAADGDNFGNCMAALKDKAILFNEFGAELRRLVFEYGGQVIYQGGDDISFYAPLFNENQKMDIIGLIARLDNALKHIVSDNPDVRASGIEVSLSYGLAISYEKHPMTETRQRAEDLLHKAKSVEGKNALVWEIRKHSGQLAGNTVRKRNEALFSNTCGIMQYASLIKDEYLHSITYWLKRYEEPLLFILENDSEDISGNRLKDKMLGNFIKKNFNEDVHDRSKELLWSLMPILLDEDFARNPQEAIDYLHNALRYIELIIRKPNE